MHVAILLIVLELAIGGPHDYFAYRWNHHLSDK